MFIALQWSMFVHVNYNIFVIKLKTKKKEKKSLEISISSNLNSLPAPTIGRHFNYRQAWQRTSLRPTSEYPLINNVDGE